MLKMSIEKTEELFALIAQEADLYMPIEKGGKVEFHLWKDDQVTRLDSLNTVKSAKDSFFPQTENIAKFKTNGKTITVQQEQQSNGKSVYFGVRGCDAKSFEILDRVFLSDPVDTFYQNKRQNSTIITTVCNEPEETCFCTAFGIDPTNPLGDVATSIISNTLFWQSQTPKGDALTEKVQNLFERTTKDDEFFLISHKNKVQDILKSLPLSNINLTGFDEEHLSEKFESPKWKELSKACIGCGTCTFVCPTCQCYDIRDFDNGSGVQRFRCWDSCMYSDFTKMAHGNPRTSQVERFRQRFMHKLVYFPANNNGEYSCVGCGRCLQKCPISMNIVKVIKVLGGKDDK